jgi:hypothetical protein
MPPMMGRGRISGVLNSNDASANEMSYVDMHDLHPVNEKAAMVHGVAQGAASGATLAMIPAGLITIGGDGLKNLLKEEGALNYKNWKLGVSLLAFSALVMGAVKGYTAKQDAKTHNDWSDRVLQRMEQREAALIESKSHVESVEARRENSAQNTERAV